MTDGRTDDLRIAAIVPCHDEETAVGRVVADLRAAMPAIEVFVYDNCSTDGTVEVAVAAGAEVRSEPVKGKGNVIRRALADIDADVYVMVDGDDTYDAAAVPEMVRVLLSGPYDQVTGVRTPSNRGAYRSGHEMGNRMFNRVVSRIFGYPGQRHAQRLPRLLPALRQVLPGDLPRVRDRDRADRPRHQQPRPAGRGPRRVQGPRRGVGEQAADLPRRHPDRPDDHPAAPPRAAMALYSTIAALTTLAAVGLGIPVIDEYLRTGLVGRFPTAFLAASLVVVAFIVLVVGILLDGLRKIRQENTRIAYMAIAPPPRRDLPATAPVVAPTVTTGAPTRSEVPAPERSSERV